MKNPPRRLIAVAVAASLTLAGSLVTAPIAQAVPGTGIAAKPVAKTKITSQPKSITTAPGKTAKITVKASGQSLKYQWYSKKSGAKKWQKISGKAAKKATYSVKATTKLNKTQYRVVVTGKKGTATSKTATLTVSAKTRISTQPKSVSVVSGKTAKFSVKASGQSLKYQWYSKKSGAKKWQKISGKAAKKSTYSVKATTKLNKTQYRVVVTGKQGKVTSKAATLALVTKPKITSQPRSEAVDLGSSTTLSVKATGPSLTYRWERYDYESDKWLAVPGATRSTLKVSATDAEQMTMYRVKVSNAAGTVTSDEAIVVGLSSNGNAFAPETAIFAGDYGFWVSQTKVVDIDYYESAAIAHIVFCYYNEDYSGLPWMDLEVEYVGTNGLYYDHDGEYFDGDIWDTTIIYDGECDEFSTVAFVPTSVIYGGSWSLYNRYSEWPFQEVFVQGAVSPISW